MTNTESPSSSRPIVRSLTIAAVILGVTFLLVSLAPEYISTGLSHRLLGVMLGLVVIGYANAVPKALAPLMQRRNPAAEQAVRRFTGWSLLLGGVGYAMAWAIAPLEYANAIAGGILSFAVMTVIARIVLGMARETPAEPSR